MVTNIPYSQGESRLTSIEINWMQASRARRGKEDLGYSWRGRESPVAEAGAGAGAGKDLTGSLRTFSTKSGLFIQPAQT